MGLFSKSRPTDQILLTYPVEEKGIFSKEQGKALLARIKQPLEVGLITREYVESLGFIPYYGRLLHTSGHSYIRFPADWYFLDSKTSDRNLRQARCRTLEWFSAEGFDATVAQSHHQKPSPPPSSPPPPFFLPFPPPPLATTCLWYASAT